MSSTYLDTRYIDGKRELLFVPFPGFSPKFLKEVSNFRFI
ncbi:malate:quinone oxidoreductase [Winogradskyella sp. UBA3174]